MTTCVYCGKAHEEICQKNPAYWDGPEDQKVIAVKATEDTQD